MKKNIAVIMGGFSSEKDISLKSGKTIIDNLDKEKYNIYSIVISKEKWYCVENNKEINKNDFSLEGVKFDAVYNIIHGTPGEDGKFQGYLEMLNIPHTSCNSFESAITFGKIESKSVLSNFSITNPKMIGVVYDNLKKEDISKIEKEIKFPCFVKPNRSGSSFGISKVYKKEDLYKALDLASKEDKSILIEEFIEGIEISVGIRQIENKLEILGITEIVCETDFFDYQAKYEGLSKEITPARINDKTKNILENITKSIYQILNLKGICRIDFIIKNDIPYFLEVNTIPGLSEQSIIPQQAKYSNIELKDLFDAELKKILK